jgi:hypothetical protein
VTFDEQSLEVAAAALKLDWMDRATDRELDLLVAAGERPEVFDKTTARSRSSSPSTPD